MKTYERKQVRAKKNSTEWTANYWRITVDNWGWRQTCLDNSYRYRIPISPGSTICEHLGVVKPRADGRWNWWRKPSQFHKWVTGQGVAVTKQGAVLYVEEGWTPPVPVDYDPDQLWKCSICGNFIAGDPYMMVKLNEAGTHMVGHASGRIIVRVHEACIWAQCYEKYTG